MLSILSYPHWWITCTELNNNFSHLTFSTLLFEYNSFLMQPKPKALPSFILPTLITVVFITTIRIKSELLRPHYICSMIPRRIFLHYCRPSTAEPGFGLSEFGVPM